MVDAEETARDHVARIVADLSRPDAYPHPVGSITLEETHISLVFLVDEFVYKVKKPVDFGFLNFTTLDQRRFFCQEELRLNRRLTDGVYLDVVPIVEVGDHLQLFGDGPVVEYAVKMRRLPDDCMLASYVAAGEVPEHVFPALAERLSEFYTHAATGPGVDEWGTAQAAMANIRENLDQTAPYAGSIIAPTQLRLIEEASVDFFARHERLFDQRVLAGAVREGHGDLHLAHVCVEGPRPEDLQIIDCIEFNPRLRCGDIAVDVAFMAMDLDYHGRPDLGAQFVSELAERLKDPDLAMLVHFFSIYRAHVRAKVACFRADELAPEMPEYLAVRQEAERYIDLATSYIVEPERPTMFLTAGLSGTGKSVIARRLARSIGATLISSDIVRRELAGRPLESHEPSPFGTGHYTPEQVEQTYQTLFARASEALTAGRSVVLDATFLDPRRREVARDTARAAGADLLLIECVCAPQVVQERLARRGRVMDEASEADWSIYQAQRQHYGDTLTQIADLPQITVDTDHPSAEVLEAILTKLSLKRRI